MRDSLLFLGDLYYDYDVLQPDITCISEWISRKGFATVIPNMEGGLSDKGNRVNKRGPNIASKESILEVFSALNISAVCLANNHTMDFSESGLKYTLNRLDDFGIQHTGAGRNLEEAILPLCLNVPMPTVLLNFGWDVEETVYASERGYGCAPKDETLILDLVKRYKASNSKVVVCLHWGFEYNRFPMPSDISLAHNIIDAGADLIIGHHPHCIQPKEIYKGKHIYYSLGNFYFGNERKSFNKHFDEPIPNQSDYGLVVSWNPATNNCEEYIIQFDREREHSDVIEHIEHLTDILSDISGVDFESNDYYCLVHQSKQNINPVLTLDERANRRKLKNLFLYYSIKRKVKSVLGRN